MSKTPKRPRDFNQLAHLLGNIATGQVQEEKEPELTPQQQYAKEFARKGGLVGGKARAASQTKDQRVEGAKKAAAARWGKVHKNPEK